MTMWTDVHWEALKCLIIWLLITQLSIKCCPNHIKGWHTNFGRTKRNHKALTRFRVQNCNVFLSGNQNTANRAGVLVFGRVLHNACSHTFRATVNCNHEKWRHFGWIWADSRFVECLSMSEICVLSFGFSIVKSYANITKSITVGNWQKLF